MEPKEPAVEITAKTLIEFCDKYAELGKLYLEWNGGNDSGSIYLVSATPIHDDDQQFEDELVNQMDSILDYGSWAGDFSANGEAVYNTETKKFEGVNHEFTTTAKSQNIWFEIGIPSNIDFKSMYIEIGDSIFNPRVSVYFNHAENDDLRILLAAHATLISERLTELLKSIVDELEDKEVDEWNDYLSFARSEFHVDAVNNVLEISITEVDYIIEDDLANEVEIDLAEMLELETK